MIGPKRCSVATVRRPYSARYAASASNHTSSASWITRCSRTQSRRRPESPRVGELVAHLVGDVVQAFARLDRAALGDEPVEHRVHDRAAIDRAQLDDVLGLFDGIDAEHVLHEVGVRAARPLLEARR